MGEDANGEDALAAGPKGGVTSGSAPAKRVTGVAWGLPLFIAACSKLSETRSLALSSY